MTPQRELVINTKYTKTEIIDFYQNSYTPLCPQHVYECITELLLHCQIDQLYLYNINQSKIGHRKIDISLMDEDETTLLL